MLGKKSYFIVLVTIGVVTCLTRIATATSWCIVNNPANSNPEAVWSNPNGSSSDILYSYLDGASWIQDVAVAEDGANGVSPSIVIDGSGNRTIVWQTSDSPARIKLSTKSYSGGAWSTPGVVSDTDGGSRAPSATVFDGDTWVGYEVVPSSAGRIVRVARDDGNGNYPRTTVRTTSSTNPLDVKLHSEGGHLWVDWVDGAGVLGWSEYIGGAWTAMATESFGSQDDLKLARDLARMTVLGN